MRHNPLLRLLGWAVELVFLAMLPPRLRMFLASVDDGLGPGRVLGFRRRGLWGSRLCGSSLCGSSLCGSFLRGPFSPRSLSGCGHFFLRALLILGETATRDGKGRHQMADLVPVHHVRVPALVPPVTPAAGGAAGPVAETGRRRPLRVTAAAPAHPV